MTSLNENQLDNFINSVEDFIKDKQKENNKIINKSNYNIRELEFKKERIDNMKIQMLDFLLLKNGVHLLYEAYDKINLPIT